MSTLTLSTFAAAARPLNIPLPIDPPEGRPGWTWTLSPTESDELNIDGWSEAVSAGVGSRPKGVLKST